MNTRLCALMLSSTLVSGVGATASPSPQTAPAADAAPARTVPATPPVSTTLRMHGTLQKYDLSSRILSLSTPAGTLRFPLLPNTRILQGWHRIEALALEKFVGHDVTVRYSESGGQRTVESVAVGGKTAVRRRP